MSYMVSSCCGERLIENTDLCSKCKEHASAVSESEWYGEHELVWLDADWQPESLTYNGKEIR